MPGLLGGLFGIAITGNVGVQVGAVVATVVVGLVLGRVCGAILGLFGTKEVPYSDEGTSSWRRRGLPPDNPIGKERTAGFPAVLCGLPRAGWGSTYPTGGRGSYGASGRSAPGGPPAWRGVPISPEKWGERGRAALLTPVVDSRSLSLAGFCGGYF